MKEENKNIDLILELLAHADEHMVCNKEIDKIISFISFDNLIEISITIYLQSFIKNKKKIKRKMMFYKKLDEFFQITHTF